MILVPFISARTFIALGFRVMVRVPNTFAVKGCYDMALFLTAVGVEKRERMFRWIIRAIFSVF